MRKDLVAATLIIALACAASITWVIYDARKVVPSLVTVSVDREVLVAPSAPLPRPTPVKPATQELVVELPALRLNTEHPRVTLPTKPRTPQPNLSEPLVITEAAGREALSLVGVDDKAGAIWYSAINDGSLAPNQRKNLIEDLNETGFANPRNITQADLPLIENRIAIIEQLAPEAIDQVNAAAFNEAYKDLQNMRGRLVQP